MKKVLLLLAWLPATLGVRAQTTIDTTLSRATLEQCIQYALKHQPLLAQARLDEEIAASQIRSRLADWLPQIGGNYSLQHNFQRQTSVFNGQAVPIGVANTSTAQLYLNQAIFNRDVLLASRTQNEIRLQAEQNTVARTIDITAAVSKAFYDVLTTQQQIRVGRENALRIERSLNDAYYRYEAGVTDKTDYKRAQIALNNLRATIAGNEASLTARIENLKSLMGYPSRATLNPAYDSLAMEAQVAFDTLQRPDLNRRIEYNQLQTVKRLQENNVVYQRNAFLPTVSANAVYNFNYFDNNFGKLYSNNFPNSFVGLTAGIPIFQGNKRRANIRTAQLQLARVDLDILNLENSINSQYASALGSYKTALANYNASKQNIALAREVYDVIQLQYRAGVKTYLEVITSETDLRTAEINYFNALNGVLLSKVDAERALGIISY